MASHKSPRAPSFSLEDLLKSAVRLYESNGKHSMAADVAAKQLGYSGANNGSAARALASLKAFGLLSSGSKGEVSVSPEVESFRYTPDEREKSELLIKWLRAPKVYAELLDEYRDRLPSDDVLRHRLIKMGFNPSAAEECLKNFRASVEYAGIYEAQHAGKASAVAQAEEVLARDAGRDPIQLDSPMTPARSSVSVMPQTQALAEGMDRILVRLGKGRKAWIEVPNPFYLADKQILKSQIDLIFTDDEEGE